MLRSVSIFLHFIQSNPIEVDEILLFIFIFVSLLHLFFLGKNLRIQFFSKPILIPLLISFYIFKSNDISCIFILALFCCWVGDVFLMSQKNRVLQLIGGISFLCGHIFYCIAFLQYVPKSVEIPILFYLSIIPYIIFCIIISRMLIKKHVPIPLFMIVYLIVLLLMSFFALLRVWFIPVFPFLFTFAGSLLFIVSDSLLLIHTYITPYRYGKVYCMFIYILAQLCIVLGF